MLKTDPEGKRADASPQPHGGCRSAEAWWVEIRGRH